MTYSLKIWIFLLLVWSLGACSIEAKLASNATQNLQKMPVLVVFPEVLLLQNSKKYHFPDSISEDERYFAAIDSSFFLKNCDDSIYQSEFSFSTIKYFQEFGLKVYTQSELDSFLNLKSAKLIVDFSQLQLEEMWKIHTDVEIMPDELEYREDFILNALVFNAWISVSLITNDSVERNLIFSEYLMKDNFEGVFLMNNLSGEVFYDYNFKPLKPEDAQEIIDAASLKINLDILDFVINNNLEKKMMENAGRLPDRFWRYIPKSKHPSPIKQKSGYIILE
jgi:hypothetical protein